MNVLKTTKLLAIATATVTACSLLSTAAFAAEPTIDELLDEIGAGDLDESGASLFKPLGRRLSGTLLFEEAGFRGQNAFGIYNAADPNDKYELFQGSDAAPKRRKVRYEDLFEDFGATFNGVFGFYIENQTGTYYSEADLNEGYDHFLAFLSDRDTLVDNDTTLAGVQPERQRRANGERMTNKAIVAFEDVPYDHKWADFDYNDFVAIVRHVEPVGVPEPATLLGLAALAGSVVTLRRRSA